MGAVTVSRKIRRLVYIALFPPVIGAFVLSLGFIVASQVRERDNWENGTCTSIELMAVSSTIKTYAEYRSYGLVQEAGVYSGFIGDNLLILSSSFIGRNLKMPEIHFVDEKNNTFVSVIENSIQPLEPSRRKNLHAKISSMPSGGLSRPGFFGGGDYRFSRRIEYDGQEFFIFMELPDPFTGARLILVLAGSLFTLGIALFIIRITATIRKAIGKITDPVEHLTEISTEVMAGNLAVRAIHESDDEIGDLADAFNRMLDQLSQLLYEKTRILESITDGFIAIGADWSLTYVNEKAERILGLDRAAILGRKNWEVFPFTMGTEIETMYRSVMKTRATAEMEYFNTFKDQWFNRWIAIKAGPMEDGGISVFLRDITERKEAENAVKVSLHQKELLLHEVHHRVKNNLQIVASLVDLQTMLDGESDSALSEAFKNRIRTMSDIYECLSESADFSSIDFRSYAQSLASYLYMFYRRSFDAVSFEIEADNVRLDMNQAFPCGLILNEILSNSFAYGFPKEIGRAGMIRIILRERDESRLELVVEDDGIGIPPGTDGESSKGMGLPLISILSRQLEGTMDISRDGGTRYSFKFKRNAGARISGGLPVLFNTR